mmetsp:Transcript_2596/g.3417  ORF Transcript_2596/g.3417 Transcript_2596/m.3417 type:complete len:195 (+) Transcript_2596:86-670(+)
MADLVRRLLSVIEEDILPKTEKAVSSGNKVFGAAILANDPTHSLVHADTNHEMLCPLYHGEVYTIQQWSGLSEKPLPKDSVFLSTHEPCCMCISSICWAGFPQVYYLFSYENTKSQGIPHDIKIMHELWGVESYVTKNEFLTSTSIRDLINNLPEEDKKPLLDRVTAITNRYEELSSKYHTEKASNSANTLAFD